MNKLLLLLLALPVVALGCNTDMHIIQKMINNKSVTVEYKPNELIVTCDTKIASEHACAHVFKYYRERKNKNMNLKALTKPEVHTH